MRTASLLLLCVVLVASCPDSYLAAGDGACYFVTSETAPHWGCSVLCGSEASLACIGSAEESELLAEPALDAWLGTFRSEAGGWDCSSGAPASFIPWAAGEPAVAEFECARMAPSNLRKRGTLVTALCSEERRCVCALGANASAAYNASRLEANAAVVEAEDAAQVQLMVIVAIAVGVGVSMLLCCGAHAHLHRLNTRRQANAHAAATAVGNAEPVAAAADVEASETVDAAVDLAADREASELETTAAATLKAQRDAAMRVRRSINTAALVGGVLAMFVMLPFMFVLLFTGLPFGPAGVAFVVVFGVTTPAVIDPTMPRRVRADIGNAPTFWCPLLAGSFSCFVAYNALTPSPLGLCSTREPTCALGARLTTGFCALGACAFVAHLVYLLPVLYATRDKPLPPVKQLLKQQKRTIAEDGGGEDGGDGSCLYLKDPTAATFYLLEGAGYYAMPVHAAMEIYFRGLQVFGVFVGASFIAFAIAVDTLDIFPASYTWESIFPMGLALALVWPITLSPPARRAILAWLGGLRSAGEQRQAAAVAGLLGGLSPAKALAIGKATFRGLPFSSLTAADLGSNADTGLNTRVVPLALGNADAFMSHSWHDDATAKWVALQAWAARFEAEHKHSPMLWLDKACIDQQNISASLAFLPVYLAGCQRLLVLAGSTYVERLWCVVEVFTFFQMGGELERVDIVPLGAAIDFNRFDVRHAKCFDPNDKAKLLTAIESAFGAYGPFNATVRQLLTSASGEPVVGETAHKLRRSRSSKTAAGGAQVRREPKSYTSTAAPGSAAVSDAQFSTPYAVEITVAPKH